MSDDVRCSGCGYLAIRAFVSRKLAEVEGDIRQTGICPVVPGERGKRYALKPICFVQAQVLHGQTAIVEIEPPEFVAIINHPRQCAKFTPWQQGFSPRDHAQMIQQIELAKLQDARDQKQRDFQADQAAMTRRHNNRSILVSTSAMLIALVGLLLAVFRSPATSPSPVQVITQPAPAPIVAPEPEPTPTID